ncbi:MAG: energy transducer TonB [Proteobacteria bacterium]|jgi:protein TonB|nr:energy transducer TonB [Pseudomonadota bacterium]
MTLRSESRHTLALILSGGVHALLVALLLFLPTQLAEEWDIVDMTISEKAKPPPPPPPPPEEEPVPETEPEQVKVKPKAKPEEPPPPPPEEEPPKPETAPPVFDLGDNTFAEDGSGASWALGRSEGNTKFGALAKPGQKPARDTSPSLPSGDGKGFKPVPAKDLSRRPEPREGDIRIPPYPTEAKREGIEGRVILQVFIGKDGAVKNVRVIKDPGGGLGAVAKAAMLDERWKPALDKKGDAVDTVITYAYVFVLDG